MDAVIGYLRAVGPPESHASFASPARVGVHDQPIALEDDRLGHDDAARVVKLGGDEAVGVEQWSPVVDGPQ